MNQSNDNTNSDVQQQQQYTSGITYYPQYYYPQYSQAGAAQPMSVNFASNNKKDGKSTGLTVLKVVATLLFIALTIGVGILAWKAYKKADKTIDKANEKIDKVDETMDKANKTIDTINAKYEYAGDLFVNGKYVPLLNSNSETSLADLAKLNGQNIGGS